VSRGNRELREGKRRAGKGEESTDGERINGMGGQRQGRASGGWSEMVVLRVECPSSRKLN